MKTLRYKNFVEENSFKEFCSSLLLLRDLLKKKSKIVEYFKEAADEENEEVTAYDSEFNRHTIKISDMIKMEEKFPDLLKLQIETQKFTKQTFDKVDSKFQEKLEQFQDKLTEAQSVKEALSVLGDFIKENGVLKTFKFLTTLVKVFKAAIEFEKKISQILPKGEKYVLRGDYPGTSGHLDVPIEKQKFGTNLIIGGQKTMIEKMFETFEKALTVKNLIKVMTGKTEDLEKISIEYLKKDGEEAIGQLKEVEITDDGDIKVSIENDKVGEVEKNLSEITGEAEGEDEQSLQKKMVDLIKTKPEEVKRILKFTNFISDEKNKDKIVKIDGIMQK